MFTGIIETTAKIRTARARGGGIRITLEKPRGWRVKRGASVAIDGVCLTSVGAPGARLDFDLTPETLSKTTALNFASGRIVNVERPLRVGGELGGHFVQGHVDTATRVRDVVSRGRSRDLVIDIPPRFRGLVAEIGSIAVNGVSLTVSRKAKDRIVVSLIPHTIERTNLGSLKKGDNVNVEFDVLARYLAALKGK